MRLASLLAAAAAAAFLVMGIASCSGDMPGQGEDVSSGPSVIIITLDTTRRDHLGCYGSDGVLTPSLDEFAAGSVRFENCFSTTHTTNPSHASIFTSLYLKDHRVLNNKTRLADNDGLMAKRFRDAGYRTAAFTSSFHLTRSGGLGQGFDEVHDCENQRPAAETNKDVFDWLDRRTDGKFFAWIHYYDPHMPYEPPSPYDGMYAGSSDESLSDIPNLQIDAYEKYFERSDDPQYYRNQYKGEVSYMDSQLGRLFARLRESGLYDDTLIVIVADHGESLGGHGYYFYHKFNLYDDAIRVPLLIKTPGGSHNGPRAQQVSSVDIYPTVLGYAGIPALGEIRGIDLSGIISDPGAPRIRDEVYSEGAFQDRVSIRTQDYTYIKVMLEDGRMLPPDEGSELYSNQDDPYQEHNIAGELPEVTDGFLGMVGEYLKDRISPGDAVSVDDEETARKLKALGYVN